MEMGTSTCYIDQSDCTSPSDVRMWHIDMRSLNLIGRQTTPTHLPIALVSVVSRGRGNEIVGVARTGSDSVVRQCIREGVAPVIIMGD